MRLLVTYASRHSSTAEIAEVIGSVLTAMAVADVDVRPVEDVDDVEDYEAVLVGSAIYDGRWLKPARRFVHANRNQLVDRAVWLFSSGPIGEPPEPNDDADEVTVLAERIQAEGQVLFAGQLRSAELQLAERSTVHQLHSVDGDYRGWDSIRAWAAEVADSLRPQTST